LPEAEGGTFASPLNRVAEVVSLLALVAAPWPYGCAGDGPRYVLVAVLLASAALAAAAAAHEGRGLPALAAPAGALLLCGALQAATGLSVAPVWTAEAILVAAAMLGTAAFWSERGADRGAAARLAWLAVAVCLAQAAFGAVQWSLAPNRIYGRETAVVTTPFGSFVDHNHFAGLVEMGAVLALSMAIGAARGGDGLSPRSVMLAGASLGLGAAHLASRSRGGLLALSGGLAVLGVSWSIALMRRSSSRPRWSLAVPAAAVAVLGFGLLAVPDATRRHLAGALSGPTDLSGEYRVDMAAATLRLARAHVLAGSGIGAYADAVPAFKQAHGEVRTTHAESDVLELVAEVGLLGLGLGLWLAALALRGFLERLLRGRDPFRKGIAIGAAAAAGAMLVHSLVDFNLRVPSNALMFASLAGLAAAPRSDPRRLGGPGIAGLTAVILSLLALASAWRAAGAWALAGALERPERQLQIARLDAVLPRHPYLAEGFRARGVALRDLAWGSGDPGGARLARADGDLRRALALRPAWGEAWADRAWVRALQRDAHGAREDMARAEALDPTHNGIRTSREALAAWLDRPALPEAAQ
jgi:hypothetical protein